MIARNKENINLGLSAAFTLSIVAAGYYLCPTTTKDLFTPQAKDLPSKGLLIVGFIFGCFCFSFDLGPQAYHRARGLLFQPKNNAADEQAVKAEHLQQRLGK